MFRCFRMLRIGPFRVGVGKGGPTSIGVGRVSKRGGAR